MSEEWVPFIGPVRPFPSSPAAGPALPPAFAEASDWARALAAFEEAARELGRFEAAAPGRAADEAGERGYDARLGAMYAALKALLAAPAPDLAALRRKIVLIVDFEVGTLHGAAQLMAALKRDAERLC